MLSVTGVEAESDLDFAGMHSLVRPIVGLLPRLPAPQRAALAAGLGLMPAAGSDRFLVSAGVLSLLAEAAEERPLLCVIDDAQWLDTPSADALVFTARRVGAEGIAVLFAARDGERRYFEAPRASTSWFSRGSISSSARVLLDRGTPELAPAVRERLLEDAAGNPLALLELPAGLSDAQLAGRALLPDAIPLNSRLQAAFSQRVQRLPDSTQAALLLAAAEADGEPAIVLRAAAALGLASEALDRGGAGRPNRCQCGAAQLPTPARPLSGVRVGDTCRASTGSCRPGRSLFGARARRPSGLALVGGDHRRR